jgi:hypothetical protein
MFLLSERNTYALPLSIGTSLALETFYPEVAKAHDKSRVVPEGSISEYAEVWVNLQTLYRNIIQAIPDGHESQMLVHIDELTETMSSEMDIIKDLISSASGGLCTVVYYECTYSALRNGGASKYIKFREDSTPYKKEMTDKYTKAIKVLKKSRKDIRSFDSDIKPDTATSAVMISHIPYDLCSYGKFSKLELLESHTGVIKTRSNWNSKYYPVPGYETYNLPFNRKILLILGDKVLVKPSDLRLRKIILDCSIKHNWHPLTTMEKIKLDLSIFVSEPFVLKVLMEI